MSVSYTWVGWTPHKKVYDAVIAAAVVAYVGLFMAVGLTVFPADRTPAGPVLLIRALGTCGILMLHIILWIGPLARLDRRFLPLLFNRRHLGVSMFLVGLGHAGLSLLYYHGFGNVNPLVSLLVSNTQYGSLSRFPFEILGLMALGILFLMAATSHDFWLKALSPRAWKSLHMLVYAAYGLLVMHVALGALQRERSPAYAGLLLAGVLVTAGLHLAAAEREVRREGVGGSAEAGEFVDVCGVDDIASNRAKVVCLKGRERIAVFKYDGKVSAVSNVCEHQGGPLGEGKVVDGCITCPWHGWQYRPGDGQSPPPFKEKIATYQVRVQGRRVLVNPSPLPKGTPVEPAMVEESAPPDADPGRGGPPHEDEFYIGYLKPVPRGYARRVRATVMAVAALTVAVAGAGALFRADAGDAVWAAEEVTLVGLFRAGPYPTLRLEGEGGGSPRTLILVGVGKCGAFEPDGYCGLWGPTRRGTPEHEEARAAAMRLFDGKLVQVKGTTLRRGERMMLELSQGERSVVMAPGTVEPGLLDRLGVAAESGGTLRLRGEVVDPKCFQGAMKPGEGKTHRACAVRCISGGIPPMLAVSGPRGYEGYLLTDPAGGPLRGAILPFVGDRVEAVGEVWRIGDLRVLRVDPAALRRL